MMPTRKGASKAPNYGRLASTRLVNANPTSHPGAKSRIVGAKRYIGAPTAALLATCMGLADERKPPEKKA